MNFTDDNGVIQAFMDQEQAKSRHMKTDGQSLFSFSTRIAEHIPDGQGRGATLVYDYTYGGGAYISGTTSNHVRLTKKQVPYQNWMSVEEAREHGLITEPLPQVNNGTDTRNSR
jgi:hypothetical protein